MWVDDKYSADALQSAVEEMNFEDALSLVQKCPHGYHAPYTRDDITCSRRTGWVTEGSDTITVKMNDRITEL